MADIRLGSFDGDYDALASLMRRSWAGNRESSLDYTSEFLRSCLRYPGSTAEFAPTLYEEDDPIAFIAGFPRQVEWCGKSCKFLLSTFMTSAPEHRGKRYGTRLWTELVHKARATGYDGVLSFTSAGRHLSCTSEDSECGAGFPTGRIFSVDYQSVLINRSADVVTDCVDTQIDLFLELAMTAGRRAPFRRSWTRKEAEWQCRERLGAVVATLDEATGHGMATGYVVDTMPPSPVRALLIEDLLWDDLKPDERVLLLRRLMEQGGARGARIASVAITGYTDYECIKQLGFRPIPRRMDLWVTRWDGPTPEPVDRVYIDVL